MRDGARYLADLSHPLARQEHEAFRREAGLRYDEPLTNRHRRELDRRIVAKHGKAFPPPPRAVWALLTYDIQDAEEDRQKRAKSKTAG